MLVITITGDPAFDYFSTLFIYMTITLISMFGILSIFSSK